MIESSDRFGVQHVWCDVCKACEESRTHFAPHWEKKMLNEFIEKHENCGKPLPPVNKAPKRITLWAE